MPESIATKCTGPDRQKFIGMEGIQQSSHAQPSHYPLTISRVRWTHPVNPFCLGSPTCKGTCSQTVSLLQYSKYPKIWKRALRETPFSGQVFCRAAHICLGGIKGPTSCVVGQPNSWKLVKRPSITSVSGPAPSCNTFCPPENGVCGTTRYVVP